MGSFTGEYKNLSSPRAGKYSVGFKKRAVAKTLVLGVCVSAVARSHGLNPSMVCGWRKVSRFQPPDRKCETIEAELASLRVDAVGRRGALISGSLVRPQYCGNLQEPPTHPS